LEEGKAGVNEGDEKLQKSEAETESGRGEEERCAAVGESQAEEKKLLTAWRLDGKLRNSKIAAPQRMAVVE
jgi:hypothetical protein